MGVGRERSFENNHFRSWCLFCYDAPVLGGGWLTLDESPCINTVRIEDATRLRRSDSLQTRRPAIIPSRGDAMGKTSKDNAMRTRYLVRALLALSTIFGLVACGPPDEGEDLTECTTTNDCEDGEACRKGLCLARCTSGSDCADGESCGLGGLCIETCEGSGECDSGYSCDETTGACWIDGTSFNSCTVKGDCAATEYCAEGACLSATCQDDAHCAASGSGQTNICDNGTCVPGCRGDSDCDTDETCNDDNLCEGVACTPTSCDHPHKSCQELDGDGPSECRWSGSCARDVHCDQYASQEGFDVPYSCQDIEDGEGECKEKPPCEEDADCGSAEICVQHDDSRNECRPGCRCDHEGGCERPCGLGAKICNDSNECRQGCQTDAECGDDGVCIENVCEDACETFSDCDDNFACRTDEGGDDRYCQPCDQDNQCPAGRICEPRSEGDDIEVCIQEPPACEKDGYGDNHSDGDDAPYVLESDDLPFDTTSGDMPPRYCNTPNTQPDYEHNGDDWWRLNLGEVGEEGRVVEVELEYQRGEEGSNLDVALWNTSGTSLMTSEHPPSQETVVDEEEGIYRERIVYGVESSTDFLIQVRGEIAGDNLPYDLKVDAREPAPCNDSNDDSLEENDDLDTAEGNDPLPAGQAFQDLVVCGDDEDYYKLDVDANQIVDVTAQDIPPRLGEIRLRLFDEDKSPISSSGEVIRESGMLEDESNYKLQFVSDEAATYYVGVEVVQHRGQIDYNLEWSQSENNCADEYEVNDSCENPAQAYQLVRDNYVGTTTTIDNLSVCNDRDFYAIDLNPKDRIEVTARYYTDDVNAEMQLNFYGPNICTRTPPSSTSSSTTGTDDEGAHYEELSVVHEVPIDDAGTFYINVQKFQGEPPIPHQLDISIEAENCQDDDLEPNDDQSSGTQLDDEDIVDGGRDAALVEQRICDDNVDWYCTDLESGEEVEWEARFDNSLGNLDAYAFDPSGSQVASSTKDSSDPEPGVENLTHTAGSDGEYCVRIEGASPVRNDYDLLTFIDGEGTEDRQCPDIYEDNDTCTDTDDCEAQQLSSGTDTDDLLSCQNDDDWYTTCVEPGQELSVETDFVDGAGNIDTFLWEEHADFTDLSETVDSTTATGTKTVSDYSNKEQCYYYNVVGDAESNNYDIAVDTTSPTQCKTSSNGWVDNGSDDKATQVEVPGIVANQQKCEDASDWYEIELDDGQEFEAFVPHDATYADLDLAIYDGTGSSPVEQKTATSEDDDESLEYTAQTTGTHYVEVTTKDRARTTYELLLYADQDGDDDIQDGEEGPADRVCPDRFEDNDSESEATRINVGTYEDLNVCNDQNATSEDADIYEILVPKDATITVESTFTHEDGDIDMSLMRGSVTDPEFGGNRAGNSPSEQSSPGDGVEEITHTNNDSGETYYLMVYGNNTFEKNYYTLDVSLSFAGSCDEDQFGGSNGSKSNAEPLSAVDYDGTSGGSESGLMLCEATGSYSGEDWFEVGTDPGDVMFALEHRSAPQEIEMELQDDAGNVVATADDHSEFGSNIKMIDETGVTGDGPYYLRVHPSGDAIIRNAYDLWASFGGSTPSEPLCPDTYERNDERTTDDAEPLSLTDQVLQTTQGIACGAETDWYQIELDGGTTYHWDVFHEDTSDLAIEVRDGPGGSAGFLSDDSGDDISFGNNTTTADETVSFEPSSDGTYYLGVKNMGSGAVPYNLEIAVDSAFGTDDSPASSCPEDGYEVNDNPGQARPLDHPDLPLRETLGACGNDDYFTWTPSSSTNQVTTTLQMNNNLMDLGLQVHEVTSSGGRNFLGEDLGLASGAKEDNRATVTFDAESGTTYMFTVWRQYAKGESSPASGPYFLTVD